MALKLGCVRHHRSFSCCAVFQSLEILGPSQTKLVDVYIDSLLRWNEKINLTSVTSREEIMDRHVSDSLALLPVIDETLSKHCSMNATNSLRVVDVGSGAGLPGIIFGIARPHWQVTLVESIRKKCDFLEDTLQNLGIENVDVVRARAEDKGQEIEYREVYDIAVARAVAEMRVLAELCLPLVCIGGIMVAAKGANPQEEVQKAKRAVKLLGGSLLPVLTVASKSPFGMRTAVVSLKRSSTPKKYPREPGTPGKNPL